MRFSATFPDGSLPVPFKTIRAKLASRQRPRKLVFEDYLDQLLSQRDSEPIFAHWRASSWTTWSSCVTAVHAKTSIECCACSSRSISAYKRKHITSHITHHITHHIQYRTCRPNPILLSYRSCIFFPLSGRSAFQRGQQQQRCHGSYRTSGQGQRNVRALGESYRLRKEDLENCEDIEDAWSASRKM